MSYRINKTLSMSTAAGFVMDLQSIPKIVASSTQYNEVGYLRIAAVKTGGAAADFFVQPVVVAPGGTVPSAPSGTPAVPGQIDYVHVISGAGGEIQELGQKFAPGYSAANSIALGAPVATHLLVWCVAAGDLVITGQ